MIFTSYKICIANRTKYLYLSDLAEEKMADQFDMGHRDPYAPEQTKALYNKMMHNYKEIWPFLPDPCSAHATSPHKAY